MDKILQQLLMNVLTNYIQTSLHVTQKNILMNRRPQQYQVDNAFTSLMQNIPAMFHQVNSPAVQPAPAFDISQLLQGIANIAPQQGVQQPVATTNQPIHPTP